MTDKNEKKDKLQLIVNNGIVYNKKDILMLLRDIGNANFYEVINGNIVNKGKGFIYRVCANSEEPTLFLSGRVYINVNSFDYLRVSKAKSSNNTLFELVSDDRTIKLVPLLSDRTSNPLVKGSFADRMEELGLFNDDTFHDDNLDLPFDDGFLDN